MSSMSERGMSISIPLDSDGFLSLECPFCEERFKLSAGEVEGDDVSEIYCPICGLTDEPSNFKTKEVVDAINVAFQNMAYDFLNDEMKAWERRSRGNKLMTFKAGPPIKHEPEVVLIEDDSLDIHTFDCCKRRAKVRAIDEALILKCPYCGVAE